MSPIPRIQKVGDCDVGQAVKRLPEPFELGIG